MPRVTELTPDDLTWLNAEPRRPNDLAARLSCHRDTALRIMIRLGLINGAHYAAKYQVSGGTRPKPAQWDRPCLCCGSRTPRPRMQFRCNPCLERARDIY